MPNRATPASGSARNAINPTGNAWGERRRFDEVHATYVEHDADFNTRAAEQAKLDAIVWG